MLGKHAPDHASGKLGDDPEKKHNDNCYSNIFEQFQSFTQILDNLNEAKSNIIQKIHEHNHELSGKLECDNISCDDYYMLTFNKLAETVFNLFKNYRRTKSQIYEYMIGLIKQ